MMIAFSVKATGETEQRSLGEFSFVKIIASTQPFQISFDGVTFQTVTQNDYLQTSLPRSNVFARALNGLASVFTLKTSKTPFSSQDTAQSNVPTNAIGNFGILPNTAAAGGMPACDANGYLQITNNMQLPVPSSTNGHRRQMLLITMSANSPFPLNILDANGCAFMTLAIGAPAVMFPTDSAFILSGASGTAWATVGQVFLANN